MLVDHLALLENVEREVGNIDAKRARLVQRRAPATAFEIGGNLGDPALRRRGEPGPHPLTDDPVILEACRALDPQDGCGHVVIEHIAVSGRRLQEELALGFQQGTQLSDARAAISRMECRPRFKIRPGLFGGNGPPGVQTLAQALIVFTPGCQAFQAGSDLPQLQGEIQPGGQVERTLRQGPAFFKEMRIEPAESEIMSEFQPGPAGDFIERAVRAGRVGHGETGPAVVLRVEPVRTGRLDGIEQLIEGYPVVRPGPGQNALTHLVEALNLVAERADRISRWHGRIRAELGLGATQARGQECAQE